MVIISVSLFGALLVQLEWLFNIKSVDQTLQSIAPMTNSAATEAKTQNNKLDIDSATLEMTAAVSNSVEVDAADMLNVVNNVVVQSGSNIAVEPAPATTTTSTRENSIVQLANIPSTVESPTQASSPISLVRERSTDNMSEAASGLQRAPSISMSDRPKPPPPRLNYRPPPKPAPLTNSK